MSVPRQSQMRPVLVAPGSTDTGVRFEESAGGTVVQLDLASVGLIDVVAGNDSTLLPMLLSTLWDGSFKEEARSVLDAALVCRDPLSDLGAICGDALATLADIDKLIRVEHWTSLVAVTGHTDSPVDNERQAEEWLH